MRLDTGRRIGTLAFGAILVAVGHAGSPAGGQEAQPRAAVDVYREDDFNPFDTGPRAKGPRRFVPLARTFSVDVIEVVAGDRADEEDDGEAGPPVRRNSLARAALSIDNFDRWMFGNMGTGRQRRDWLGILLEERIERLHSRRPLAAAERVSSRRWRSHSREGPSARIRCSPRRSARWIGSGPRRRRVEPTGDAGQGRGRH